MKEIFKEKIGRIGRLIAYSKSSYRIKYPKNLIIFNSNVLDDEYKKVWYGDLDITLDKPILMEIAKQTNRKFYVLSEYDARFDTEKNPNIQNFVVCFYPNGEIELGPVVNEFFNNELKKIK